MNCRDTERLWNELIDASRPDLEAALDAHAASCPACAAIGRRYRTLRQTLAGWELAPVASPAFVDRLRNLTIDAPATIAFPPRPTIRVAAWLTAAAAVVLALVVGWRTGRLPVKPIADPAIAHTPTRSISDALADATSATLELARETSAPAGRVGRVVLDSTALPDAESPLTLRVTTLPTAEILQSVSDRVGAGVRPLSGSARQAFGLMTARLPPLHAVLDR
jgi:hypothetical protein